MRLCIYRETIERVTQFAYGRGGIRDNTGGTEAHTTERIRKAQTSIQRTKQDLALKGTLNANQNSHLQYKRESSPTLWL
jgi:hypothetical protein